MQGETKVRSSWTICLRGGVELPQCFPCSWKGKGKLLKHNTVFTGKAIMAISKADIQEAAGVLRPRVCEEAGSEVAIHATRLIFQDKATEGVLLANVSYVHLQ